MSAIRNSVLDSPKVMARGKNVLVPLRRMDVVNGSSVVTNYLCRSHSKSVRHPRRHRRLDNVTILIGVVKSK